MTKRKHHNAEQVIRKLRDAEVLLAQGMAIELMCRKLEISEQTYYRWRQKYGGMGIDEAKRLKAVEAENTGLRKIVADQALQIEVVKGLLEKKW